MNTIVDAPESLKAGTYQQAVADACGRIAPNWPLDRLIAVNPWWTLRNRTMPDTAALLGALSGARMLMPTDYFEERRQKEIQSRHLQQAARLLSLDVNESDLLDHLRQKTSPRRWMNVTSWMDRLQGVAHRMSWQDETVHQMSQTCAMVFQTAERNVQNQTSTFDLYHTWLETIQHDSGLEILMGEQGLLDIFKTLPRDYNTLIDFALHDLAAGSRHVPEYLHALLLDINGWASWVAYQEWQQQLQGNVHFSLMPQLLAVRLAWEWVLWRHCALNHRELQPKLRDYWSEQWPTLPTLIAAHAEQQRLRWCWQLANELAYGESLCTQLRKTPPAPRQTPVQLQAIFCIDVRSEPMRAALEAQSDAIQTKGFAGFFGLPIAVNELGSDCYEPNLPGLLAPQIQVRNAALNGANLAKKRNRQARLSTMSDGPASTFSLVESLGLGYALKLARDTFFPPRIDHAGHLQPPRTGWLLERAGTPLSAEDTAEMLSRILRAIGLTSHFAPTVLLVGHGSTTRNNAHAASLNCGACGGQSGLTNAQILADLLNTPMLREHLAGLGIAIPEKTQFVPALHNTVTDDIDYPENLLPDTLTTWLTEACKLARRRRAPALGLKTMDDAQLHRALERRARDWSELRPEWGLANNAAFIVAPRSATRHLDLQGRSFLHDYDWREDPNSAVLEQIMTAPMVVTQWINMQYYASVVDNLHYGSGNKMLHNVVGGHIGVFEGNGGDLRIGLPMQSLHDGQSWRHEPLRLQVYIAAPESAIFAIYQRHETIKNLIDNQWLTLFGWQPESGQIRQLFLDHWRNVE